MDDAFNLSFAHIVFLIGSWNLTDKTQRHLQKGWGQCGADSSDSTVKTQRGQTLLEG